MGSVFVSGVEVSALGLLLIDAISTVVTWMRKVPTTELNAVSIVIRGMITQRLEVSTLLASISNIVI